MRKHYERKHHENTHARDHQEETYINQLLDDSGNKNYFGEMFISAVLSMRKIIKDYFGNEELYLHPVDSLFQSKELLLKNLKNVVEIPQFINACRMYQKSSVWTYQCTATLKGIPVMLVVARVDSDPLYSNSIILCKRKDEEELSNECIKIVADDDVTLPYDKIIMSSEIKDRFKKSTYDFLFDEKMKERFKKHYMKFKRGILLHGPPGNGKSTLIAWIRSLFQSVVQHKRYDQSVFTWDDIESDSFLERDRSKKSLYILEDIDTMLTQRDKTIYDKRGSAFSKVLNLLDGAMYQDNYIVIMTANNPDIMDEALARDGRCDEKILIDYPTLELKNEYIKDLIKPLVPKKDFDMAKFKKILETKDVPFATLDNIRKKIFIYGNINDAIKTTPLKIKDNPVNVGFASKSKEVTHGK